MEKANQKEMYDFIVESTKDRAIMHEKLNQILEEVRKTNGRVTATEIKVRNLEEKMNKIPDDPKIWTYRTIGIAMLLTSWIWIKESRDFVLEIFRNII